MKSLVKFDIYKLCRSLSYNQLKQLGFFNINDESQQIKYHKCFEAIVNGSIKDDRSAKEYLDYKNHSSFLRFKHRFTNRLKSYFFLIDSHKKKSKDDEIIYKELWKEAALGRILQLSDNSSNSRALYSNIYHKAKEYEFLDIMIAVLPHLRKYYAFMQPDKKLYKYYKAEYYEANRHFQKFIKSDDYYDEISHYHVFNDLRSEVNLKEKTLQYYMELKAQFEVDDYSVFRINTYQIGSFAYLLVNDFESALKVNNEALAFLKSKKKVKIITLFHVHKDILITHLKMKNFEKALESVQELEGMGLSYNFNYFGLQNIKFLIYSYNSNFDQLYKLTHFVTSIKELKKLPSRYEQWKIKEAFAHFLVTVDKVHPSLTEMYPLKKFKLSKFVNEIELYSKDKRGANISIHVLQLLFYLKERNYQKVLERLDSLTQYTYRYLRNDDTLRSNCFIKMLLKLPEAEYNPIRTKRYVSKYWKKLKENPLEISMQSTEVEIIPYEHLWEIVIEIISRKK